MTLFEYLTAAVSIVLALAVVRLVEGLRFREVLPETAAQSIQARQIVGRTRVPGLAGRPVAPGGFDIRLGKTLAALTHLAQALFDLRDLA